MKEQKRSRHSRVMDGNMPTFIEERVLLLGAHIRPVGAGEPRPIELHGYLLTTGDTGDKRKVIVCQAPAHRKFYAGTIDRETKLFDRFKPEGYGVYLRENSDITQMRLPPDQYLKLQPLEYYLAIEGITQLGR